VIHFRYLGSPAFHGARLWFKSSDSGSALILVLLITALLATIAVSFLSTSRVEMIAAKNFSRQNAASGLAEMATQQAMAQIQQGFTVNGTATIVITTQPGAIRQFTFSGGNITSNTTTELFSGTGNASTNGTVNLNNLHNPSSNTTLTSNSSNNQWTITGNASEQINVPLQNITSNGIVIGRIAYYVDDEGTKLNLNAAIGDRPTLNIGSSRSLSLSTLASANQSANFTQTINGTTNNSSSIQSWSYFFRPEQLAGLFGGNTAISGNLSKFSTAPIAGKDYHIKKTPWGTPRLFINDRPTDTANAPASVNAIYNALNSPQLRDIYGATFADKYTDLGLKQIAANILQMRDPNTNTVNASFTSTVPRIGANASETVLLTSNSTKRIPAEYFGKAPYAYINEIGAMVAWGTYGDLVCFQLAPFITILNPELQTIPKSEVDLWQIEAMIDSFTVDITYKNSLGNTVGPITYGPTGFKKNDPWGHNSSEIYASRNKRNAALGGTTSIYETEINATVNNGDYIARSDGTFKWQPNGSIPAWSKELKSGEELQVCPYHYPWAFGWQGLQVNMPANDVIEIIDISNVKVKFEYITLSSVSGNTSLLRDFVLGSETGDINCWWLPQNGHPWNRSPPNLQYQKTRPFSSHPIWHPGHMISPDFSLKRIDGRIGFTANMTTNATANMTAQTSYMRTWSANGTQSWPTKNATSAFFTNNAVTTNTDAYPSNTSGHPIPGDPVPTQSSPFYDYPAPLASTLQFIGANLTTANSSVFTSPQELGKVHTNIQHRKLRFTPQHPNEVSTGSGGAGNQTFIPDWAMLDVISFGSNVTSVPAPAPVNLNGRFHVPSGSPQIAPRMAALESALKALDSATSVGNPFNSSNTSTTNKTQYMGGGNVSATIAGNIGNLTWSTGNFTSGSATWGKGNATADPGSRRKTAKFPVNHFVLPAEVTEIQSMADVVPMDSYTSNATIKTNEGRLSSLFPGATTQSRFFTIYAYAQAGRTNPSTNQFEVDSEQVTKTLVEVEEQAPASSPPTYKVKKLYSQPINSQ
jgi:hypothetical protein